ncbi:MAG: galactokinase, partial [Lachnospiraceae bacterium]|nr:galactokinase [Lachnospiraceae bacterium]
MKETVLKGFEKVFHTTGGVKCYFAPGRVNLIGEHTDYNGGHVFPCALTIGTYAAVKERDDMKVHFYSMNFEDAGVIEADLNKDIEPSDEWKWAAYPLGIVWTFEKRGKKLPHGFDMVIAGNIPNGSGLSSSASLEVLTGYMLNDIYGFDFTNEDLALIGQYSENNFNGMNCGIMDQFASAFGKKDNAIFLDTATLNYEYVPLKLKGIKIVIANTNKKHALTSSGYNDRRRESEEALKDLKEIVPINSLGELDEQAFDKYSSS